MKHLDKAMIALDFDEIDEAKALIDELGDRIGWYKIGHLLFTRSGNEIIDFLHARKKRIFLDLKLHDTPNVVGETVKQFAEMGVSLATVHCLGGKRMLEVANAQCRGSKLKLLGVTVLTSEHWELAHALGWDDDFNGLVERMLELALEARLGGVICSPREAALVRKKTLPDFLVVTPGIRLPHKEVFEDDQLRVATPDEAFSWGADYVVVGRPITQAREPIKALEELFG